MISTEYPRPRRRRDQIDFCTGGVRLEELGRADAAARDAGAWPVLDEARRLGEVVPQTKLAAVHGPVELVRGLVAQDRLEEVAVGARRARDLGVGERLLRPRAGLDVEHVERARRDGSDLKLVRAREVVVAVERVLHLDGGEWRAVADAALDEVRREALDEPEARAGLDRRSTSLRNNHVARRRCDSSL